MRKESKIFNIKLAQSNDLEGFEQELKKTGGIHKEMAGFVLEKNFRVIYQNFSLLSYFSPSCNVQILSRGITVSKQQYNLFTFMKNPSKLYLVESCRTQFRPNLKIKEEEILTIEYCICEALPTSAKPELKAIAKIVVEFWIKKNTNHSIILDHTSQEEFEASSISAYTEEYINIDVKDVDDWITQNMGGWKVSERYDRISEERKMKLTEVQYFYKEPSDQRNRTFNMEHFSVALQGGGAKGILYLGMAEALAESQLPVKSLLCSSIGCLCGLFITCKGNYQNALRTIQDNFSIMTKDLAYPTKEGKQQVDQMFQIIFNFFHHYNLLEPKIIDTMQAVLHDEKAQREVLKIFNQVNPTLKELLSYSEETSQLNLRGLFNSGMMTGYRMKKMACQFIAELLKTPEAVAKLKKIGIQVEEGREEELAEKLTLKQLYILTEVQYTCTSVDVENKMLRFFNHKTTPDLPVYMAVKMSGSFPFAFKSHKWEPQWGKYYIHYDTIRKEIDLTGCKFTDGGFLANFPMRFLDNQDMRPMYFSHQKTNKTKLLGFGLQSSKPEQQAAEKQNREKRINESVKIIVQIALKKFGIGSSVCAWLFQKCCSKGSTKQVALEEQKSHLIMSSKIVSNKKFIPMLGMIKQLLYTFVFSKDNLTEECFAHSTFQTILTKNYFNEISSQESKNHQKIRSQIKNLQNLTENLMMSKNSYLKDEEVYHSFASNLKYLKRIFKIQSRRENQLMFMLKKVYKIYAILINGFLGLSAEVDKENDVAQILGDLQQATFQLLNPPSKNNLLDIDHQNKNSSKNKFASFSQIYLSFEKMQKNQIFYDSNIERDFQKLYRILCDVQSIIKRIYYMEGDSSIQKKIARKNKLVKILRKQLKEEDKRAAENHQLLKQLEATYKTCSSLKGKSQNQINFLTRKIAYSTISAIDNAIIHDNKICSRIKKSFSLSIAPEIFVKYLSQNEKFKVKSYATMRIRQSLLKLQKQGHKSDGIHLVLETITLSHYYFHQYYRYVREALLEINQCESMKNSPHNTNITSMTAIGYHSIAMFLHASDLDNQIIDCEVSKINNLLKIDKNYLNLLYETQNWTKTTPMNLKRLENQFLQNRQNIFEIIGAKMEECKGQNSFKKVQENIYEGVSQAKTMNKDLMGILQNSYTFVLDGLNEIKFNEDDDNEAIRQKIEEIGHKFSINTKKTNYRQEDKKYTENLSKLWAFLVDRNLDLIKYCIYQSPLTINQLIKALNLEEKKEVWKGIVIGEIMNGLNIKKFIQKNLKAMLISQDATLQEFYEASSKKITLNFPVIDSGTDCVKILNRISTPHMPVWAAVLATSSYLCFFQPVIDRPEWNHKEYHSSGKRKVINHFKIPSKNNSQLYSPNFITRLPLDFLTNHKIKEIITDKPNEIFLTFNFSDDESPQTNMKIFQEINQKKNTLTVTAITVKELIGKFLGASSLFPCKFWESSEEKNLRTLKYFGNLPIFKNLKKKMLLYLEANDSLIKTYYTTEMTLLPVHYQTLDFHLFCKPYTRQISYIYSDAMMQAYYITKQKINNFDQNGENRHTKVLYIRVEEPNQGFMTNGGLKSKQNSSHFLTVRFLSLAYPTESLMEKMRIYLSEIPFQNDNEGNYKKFQLKKQYYNLKGKILFLIIQFPECQDKNNYRIIKSYMKLNFNGFQGREGKRRFGLVYKIKYSQPYTARGEVTWPEKQYMNDYRNAIDVEGVIPGNEDNQSLKAIVSSTNPELQLVSLLVSSQQCPEHVLNNLQKPYCQFCNVFLKITFRKKQPYKCPQCNKFYTASQKFDIQSNDTRFIQCKFGHTLIRESTLSERKQKQQEIENFIQNEDSNIGIMFRRKSERISSNKSIEAEKMSFGKNSDFQFCSVCEKYLTLGLWIDPQCGINICENCLQKKLIDL